MSLKIACLACLALALGLEGCAQPTEYADDTRAAIHQRFGEKVAPSSMTEVELHERMIHVVCGRVPVPSSLKRTMFVYWVGGPGPGELQMENDPIAPIDRPAFDQCRETLWPWE